jgi:ankyrin repeat protein
LQADYIVFKPVDLWGAAKRGDLQAIRRFVAEGADVNAKEADGWTPLHFAARYGQLEAIRELARLGAKIDAREHGGFTPLMLAKTKQLMEVLLGLGADINSHDKCGGTVLAFAAMEGDVDTVKFLLSQGASSDGPQGRDFDLSPLVLAAQKGNEGVVEALLKVGAKVDPVAGKESALKAAALFGHLHIVRTLLASGGDPNHRDREQQTPLMSAVRGKSIEVVRALLEAGADANGLDNNRTTALDRAIEMKLRAIIETLEAVGAKLGKEISGPETSAKKVGETFWQLPDNRDLKASLEPWPPSGVRTTLRVEITDDDYGRLFRDAIEYRITCSGSSAGTWLPLNGGEETEVGDILFVTPINLVKGVNCIQFRIRYGHEKDFICPEGWNVDV